jgi:hypothetical protein
MCSLLETVPTISPERLRPMNQSRHALFIAVLLLNASSMCAAIRCGDAGTFMYPHHMTYEGSSGDNGYPPCAMCDSSAGKWSEAFTPKTGQATWCGCNSGRYYVAAVDGSSFTCPLCPDGSHKTGISLVKACTSLTTGADVVHPPSSLITSSDNLEDTAVVATSCSRDLTLTIVAIVGWSLYGALCTVCLIVHMKPRLCNGMACLGGTPDNRSQTDLGIPVYDTSDVSVNICSNEMRPTIVGRSDKSMQHVVAIVENPPSIRG